MRLIFTLIILTLSCFGKTALKLSAGSTNLSAISRSADYAISIERYYAHGLGFELGTSFLQSTYNSANATFISFPFAAIKQSYKLNRLPFKLTFGAGFSLNHVPSSLGTHYVSTFLSGGLTYLMTRRSFLSLDYKAVYGKTNTNGSSVNFDGDTISLSVGFHLDRKKKRMKVVTPTGGQRSMPPRKKRRMRANPKQSTYQQTQQLINDLSWPTY